MYRCQHTTIVRAAAESWNGHVVARTFSSRTRKRKIWAVRLWRTGQLSALQRWSGPRKYRPRPARAQLSDNFARCSSDNQDPLAAGPRLRSPAAARTCSAGCGPATGQRCYVSTTVSRAPSSGSPISSGCDSCASPSVCWPLPSPSARRLSRNQTRSPMTSVRVRREPSGCS